MKKVGIITFHSSYNHGSVLQAQATQMIINALGYDAEIIDFRPDLFDKYDYIYCKRNCASLKKKIVSLMMLLQCNDRKKRISNFENYQTKYLHTNGKRIRTYSELVELANDYDIFVSGSDQIWSDIVPETKAAPADTILGYYLAFTEKKKISYASCASSLKEENLKKYIKFLSEYAHISAREKIGADRISKVIEKPVELVLDPSLLVSKEKWAEFCSEDPIVKEPYVLLYSLRDLKAEMCWKKALKSFSEYHKLKVVVIAPYFQVPFPNCINMLTASPAEFINLFKNAKVICTDSFHGTAFAVNFNKPFYSLGNKYWKDDIRKSSLLELLNLKSRILADEMDITSVKDFSCDFSEANRIIEEMRQSSIAYLKTSLAD